MSPIHDLCWQLQQGLQALHGMRSTAATQKFYLPPTPKLGSCHLEAQMGRLSAPQSLQTQPTLPHATGVTDLPVPETSGCPS